LALPLARHSSCWVTRPAQRWHCCWRRRQAHALAGDWSAQGEEVADYLIDAGKELIERCEDLYERSGELVEDATHELSGKYRALHEHTKQLLDEAETILRRAKSAAIGR
jgi:hypothetical protein